MSHFLCMLFGDFLFQKLETDWTVIGGKAFASSGDGWLCRKALKSRYEEKKVGKRWLHELLLDEWISYLRDLWELFGVRVNYLRDLWELFGVRVNYLRDLWELFGVRVNYLRDLWELFVIWELFESYFPTHFSKKYFKKQHVARWKAGRFTCELWLMFCGKIVESLVSGELVDSWWRVSGELLES